LDTSAPETAFAIDTVRRAAHVAERVQAEMAALNLTKSDLSPVTVADYAAQALAAHALEEAYPSEPLVAEETSEELRENEEVMDTVTRFVAEAVPGAGREAVCGWIDRGAGAPTGRYWVMDPIDGTKGYLRGGQYAVALALIADGQVQLGVFGCPQLGAGCVPDPPGSGVLAVAARGQGAWQTLLHDEAGFEPMHVSGCTDPAQARLLRSFEAGHTNVSQVDALAAALRTQAEPVLMDSMAKYAVLGAGNGELIVRLLSPKRPDYREKIWDQAAGSLIVEEAGGRITDLHGRALDFTQGRTLAKNRGILASNDRLHGAALEAIAQVADGG